ncbi:MAG: hypothetical protein JO208_13490 [Alphaproteobacteria bacterium]|nr:hypothetical protein [Alphaproteobacteria bacterium]
MTKHHHHVYSPAIAARINDPWLTTLSKYRTESALQRRFRRLLPARERHAA